MPMPAAQSNLGIALFLAKSENAVEEILNDFADTQGFDTYEDLPNTPIGSTPNNRHAVEVLSDEAPALMEKIINGFDAGIEHRIMSGQLKTQKTPQASLAALAADDPNSVVLVVTEHEEATTDLRRKKRANFAICDHGIGIAPDDFAKTIMSVGGSNKVNDTRFVGSYGFGGSGIYRYSRFTLVFSRRVGTNDIAFTVVFKQMREGWKVPSYRWITPSDGQPFILKVSDIPAALRASPGDSVPPADVPDWAENNVMMFEHGTTVKAFNLKLAEKIEIYDTFRILGFGLAAPIQLRYGIRSKEERKANKRPTVAIKSFRDAWNDTKERSKSALPVEHHVKPFPILDGMATAEMWVLGESERKKAEETNRDGPITRALGRKSDNGICLITICGQTHHIFPTGVLMRNAGLSYIAPSVAIEVNCDDMPMVKRGDYFNSNREEITKRLAEMLQDDLGRFLANEANGQLGVLNDKLRAESLSRSAQTDKEATARINALLENPITGAIMGIGAKTGTHKGTIDADGPSDRKGGKRKVVVLSHVPTVLELPKNSIASQGKEYFTIRTNAFPDWNDALSIELPDFLERVNVPADGGPTLSLDMGRASWDVFCKGEPGDRGTVKVTLDRSRINMPDLVVERSITVLNREKTTARQKSETQSSGPKFNLTAITPEHAHWHLMHQGDVKDGEVAYTWMPGKDEGEYDILYNTEFGAYLHLMGEATKRTKKNPALFEHLKLKYQLFIQMAVHSEIGAALDEITDQTKHIFRGAGAKSQCVMLLDELLTQTKRGSVAARAADAEVEEEAAA